MIHSMVQSSEQIEEAARHRTRNRIGPLRRLTGCLRPLPDFIIIGAQKCGTTALFNYLEEHPGVAVGLTKEIHFFDHNFARGLWWYRAHFPGVSRRRPRPLLGEASPSYILHPLVPERIRAAIPHARLIALFREPAARAWSHYQHNVRKGRERMPFAAAIDAEMERLAGGVEAALADPDYFERYYQFSYLLRGVYDLQLERWRRLFPPDRLLVLINEELLERPAATFGRALEFLGLPAFEPRYQIHHHYGYEGLEPAARERLEAFFAPHNRRLAALLGREIGWT